MEAVERRSLGPPSWLRSGESHIPEFDLLPKSLLFDYNNQLSFKLTDFDGIDSYLRHVRDSQFLNDANHALSTLRDNDHGRIPWGTGDGRTQWFDFSFDLDQDLIHWLGSSINSFNKIRDSCTNLTSKAYLLPIICSEIGVYADIATTTYPSIFDKLISMTTLGCIDPVIKDSIKSELGHCDSFLTPLCDNLTSLSAAIADFDNQISIQEKDFVQALQEIGNRSGPHTHSWNWNGMSGQYTHNHGFVTEQTRNDMASLDSSWKGALTCTQHLQGQLLAVRDDLKSIDRAMDDPKLFEDGRIVLNIQKTKIAEKWAAVEKEISAIIVGGKSSSEAMFGYVKRFVS